MDRLPERCRTIFLLSRNDFLKNKEIAKELGISLHTDAKTNYKGHLIFTKRVSGIFILFFIGFLSYIFFSNPG